MKKKVTIDLLMPYCSPLCVQNCCNAVRTWFHHVYRFCSWARVVLARQVCARLFLLITSQETQEDQEQQVSACFLEVLSCFLFVSNLKSLCFCFVPCYVNQSHKLFLVQIRVTVLRIFGVFLFSVDVEHSHVRFLGNLVLNLWDCGG